MDKTKTHNKSGVRNQIITLTVGLIPIDSDLINLKSPNDEHSVKSNLYQLFLHACYNEVGQHKIAKLKLFKVHVICSKETVFINYWVRHLTIFFSTTAYFGNSNTQLMSDLTDNQFYTSAEWICMCIRMKNDGKQTCDRLTKDVNFGKKNHLFR